MSEQASTLTIAQPDPLIKKGNLEENWNKWKQNFQIYLCASGISETDKTASALFLHTIGQYGRDIANELELLDIENISVLQLYEKFDKHCTPKCNLTFVRYQFFNTKQSKQTFDAFLSCLKQKSKNCKFGDLTDSLIMTQIIAGISNKKLQERLFLMEELDLEKTVQECRAAELTEAQVQQLPGAANPKRNPPRNQKPKNNASPHKQNPKNNASQYKQQNKKVDEYEEFEVLTKELNFEKPVQESQVQYLPGAANPKRNPPRNRKPNPKNNASQYKQNKKADEHQECIVM